MKNNFCSLKEIDRVRQFGGGKHLVCVRNWAWLDKESFGNVVNLRNAIFNCD